MVASAIESIRGYARRVKISYRQARRIITGKVYEKEPVPSRRFMLASGRKVSQGPTTRGAERAGRRKIRTRFWLDRWLSEFPQERRSDSEILRYWRKKRFLLPRVGTHGTTRPTPAELRRMDAFLAEFGVSPERRRRYLGGQGTIRSDSLFTVDEDTGY